MNGLGRIVAADTVWNLSSRQGVTVRYLGDGAVDTTFSGDGVVRGLEADIAGVAVDESNRVVLAASSDYSPVGGTRASMSWCAN